VPDKITKEMSVNDAIRLYPSTMGVFTGYNIDSCCGGAATIAEAAERDGIPLKELLETLNEAAS
jgi:regulator of cell morphogenesis and NO signaling